MRIKIVAGNWKMNKSFQDAEELLNEIAEGLKEIDLHNTEVVVCPPSTYLELANDFADENHFFVAAQNISDKDSGAYTGEISAMMLNSMGINLTLIGHSERRKYFNESDDFLKNKVDAALRNDVVPVFCCGEVLSEREAGHHFDVVRKQLDETIFRLPSDAFATVIVAYEPVWAIGTGVNATPQQAQEMHSAIRSWIGEKYGSAIAADTKILYGGSCNAKNAAELFSQPDVDGGLIGGASLNSAEFLEIIRIAAGQ
jgi:triosephosphate isomerase (TIM)